MNWRPEQFLTDSFPWVWPDSPAAAWRETLRVREAKDALRRYERMLGGLSVYCTQGWRADTDVAGHFEHVPDDSRAAKKWRTLLERGDGAGLQALERRFEVAESEREVRGLNFSGCGHVRFAFSETEASLEMRSDPDGVLCQRYHLRDGTPVDEGLKGSTGFITDGTGTTAKATVPGDL